MGEKTSKEIKKEISEKKPQYFLTLLEKHPEKATFLPGVEELLKQCREHGITTVVASSSKNVGPILEKAGKSSFFSAIFSGHDFTKPKPDPEIFLNAAEQIQQSPNTCIVIEDARAGMRAAKHGGFTAIGLTRTGEDMTGADMIIESLEEFPKIITTYFPHL